MENVGNTIKKYLKEQGITQKDLADKFGCTQSYITRLLNGQSNFGKKAAKQWADAFGFSYTFLITGEGSLMEDDDIIQDAMKDIERKTEITLEFQLLKEQTKNEALQALIDQMRKQLAEAYKRIGVLEASIGETKKEAL